MKQYVTVIILILLSNAQAQENGFSVDINEIFELRIDSIEQRVRIEKWGTDTSYFLHYTVENVFKDTLTYSTNSCFYYNHYALQVGQQEFDVNSSGNCSFNDRGYHKLAPGERFKMAEWITAANLHTLKTGSWDVTIDVPVVKDRMGYRVDGRDFVKNEQYLTFEGNAVITETIIVGTGKRRKNQSKAEKR